MTNHFMAQEQQTGAFGKKKEVWYQQGFDKMCSLQIKTICFHVCNFII